MEPVTHPRISPFLFPLLFFSAVYFPLPPFLLFLFFFFSNDRFPACAIHALPVNSMRLPDKSKYFAGYERWINVIRGLKKYKECVRIYKYDVQRNSKVETFHSLNWNIWIFFFLLFRVKCSIEFWNIHQILPNEYRL